MTRWWTALVIPQPGHHSPVAAWKGQGTKAPPSRVVQAHVGAPCQRDPCHDPRPHCCASAGCWTHRRRRRPRNPNAVPAGAALGHGRAHSADRRWGSGCAPPTGCQPGPVLQVRGVSVEVGGRLVVEGAAFTVRAGDKVGLVGRNGAGKTSLLQVLGGAGAADRRAPSTAAARSATCPRTRAWPACPTASPPCATSSAAAASTRRPCGWRSCACAWRRTRARRNVARYARAEERYGTTAATRPKPRPARWPPASASAPTGSTCRVSVLSGGERRRVELARILFAGSDVLLLDEPTNHLDADAKAWLLGFLRGYRGALLVISHDLELLDEAITRVLHLDRAGEEATGHLVEYKGTYSQYLAARGQDEVRLAKLASGSRPRSTGCRPWPTGSGPRPRRPRMAKSLDKRIERLQDAMVDAPKGQRALRLHFPEPPHCGRVVLEVDGLAKSLRRPDGVRRRRLRRRPGRAPARAGPQRRGQDQPAAHPRRPVRGRRRRGRASATTSSPATTPRSTRASTRAASLLDHMREQAHALPESTPAGPARHVRPHAATRPSRTRARCRAARRPSWRWPSSSPAGTTCCCSTSRPTTSTRRAGRPSPTRWPAGRERW